MHINWRIKLQPDAVIKSCGFLQPAFQLKAFRRLHIRAI